MRHRQAFFLTILSLLAFSACAHAGLWDSVANLPNAITGAFMGAIKGSIMGFITMLLGMMKMLITTNINPYDFKNLWQIMVTLISSFYLMIFLLVGFRFILGSYDETQRAKAKEWAKSAILIVLLVSSSLLLYSLLLDLSAGTSLMLWNTEFEKLFAVENLETGNTTLLACLAAAALIAALTLILRHIFLIVGVMLAPVGIFLYFIPPLKQFGEMILNTIGVAALMPVFDTMMLIACGLFYNQFASAQGMGMMALVAGFLFMGLLNLFLIYFGANKALNSVGVNVSITSVVKTMTGGLTGPSTGGG